MARFMSKKVILTMGLALVLAAGGVATASNMGFKFVKNYTAIKPQSNTLSLPYFQSQFVNASNIWTDIGAAGTEVCRLNANESRDCWTGSSFNDFAIVNQNGLIIRILAPAKTEVIVGSHDPSLALDLTKVKPQTNFKSLPYHMTYTSASQIWLDLPSHTNGVTEVCRLNANESRDCWTGSSFNDWSTVIGDAVIIRNNVSTNTWVPDHY